MRLEATVKTRRGLVVAVLLVTIGVAGGIARAGGSPVTADAAGTEAGGVAAVNAAAAAPGAERPGGCTAIDRRINLYAVELPKDPITNQVRLGYGLTPESASYPGPLIEMIEGQCFAITLYNQVPAATLEALRTDPNHPLGVSLHTHGVKYTQMSDGTVHSNSFVPPGGSRTYFWYAQPRNAATGAQGTAGYWWYHDHVVGGPHGTVGIGSGLFGGVVVRRQGDPGRTARTCWPSATGRPSTCGAAARPTRATTRTRCPARPAWWRRSARRWSSSSSASATTCTRSTCTVTPGRTPARA
ncbi:multicopper oxidase domain-containing protein [Phytohabitans flavus]|uniref:multicopper oxidase domain-containing protein n=1 Tax=Phytohabitans flavus TaxID=1076124 RepID=UPI003643D281